MFSITRTCLRRLSANKVGQLSFVAKGLRQLSAVTTSSKKTDDVLSEVVSNSTGDTTVRWSDGTRDIFPNVFLRNNCTCKTCFERSALSRTRMFLKDNAKMSFTQVSNGNTLTVHWSDGHESTYSADWLKASSFRQNVQSALKADMLLRPPRDRLWGNEMQERIKQLDFRQVMEDDDFLHDFLWELATTGIVVLENSPAETGVVEPLCNRVGFPTPYHYGNVTHVYSRDNPNALPYSSHAIPLHNDMIYDDPNPGIQIFHFVKQSKEGGENTLVDGFHAARRLEAENPEAFRLLTGNKVFYPDRGYDDFVGDFIYCSEKAPIELCETTRDILSIQVNLWAMNFRFVPLDKVKVMYEAYAAFVDQLHNSENTIIKKFQAGETLVVDNQRVLHGRQAVSSVHADDGSPYRHLEGAYFQWKEALSRLRVLRRKKGLLSDSFLH